MCYFNYYNYLVWEWMEMWGWLETFVKVINLPVNFFLQKQMENDTLFVLKLVTAKFFIHMQK